MAVKEKPAKKYYVVTVSGKKRKSQIVHGWDEVLKAGFKKKIVFRGFHSKDAAEKYLEEISRLS